MIFITSNPEFNTSVRRARVSFRSICQGRAASNLSRLLPGSHLSFCSGRCSPSIICPTGRNCGSRATAAIREMKGSLIAFNRYTPECVRTCTCPGHRDVALRQINWRGLPLRHLRTFFRKPFTVHCERITWGNYVAVAFRLSERVELFPPREEKYDGN